MIKWIIFSKDRAAQLDLLLRSMKRFIGPSFIESVNIIYKSSEMVFEDAYRDVWESEIINANWFEEKDYLSFKQILTTVVADEDARYVGLLCDDDVFVREFIPVPIPAACYTHSLRLNPRMPFSLNSQIFQSLPEGVMWGKNHFIWDWEGQQGDYAYPYSVSGSVWRSSDLVGYIEHLDFYHPNSLEDQLVSNPLNYPKMICGVDNCTLNIPSNLVQSTHNNPIVGPSAMELNEKFLEGKRIDLKPLIGIESDSCFLDYQYTFI